MLHRPRPCILSFTTIFGVCFSDISKYTCFIFLQILTASRHPARHARCRTNSRGGRRGQRILDREDLVRAADVVLRGRVEANEAHARRDKASLG